MKKTLLAVLIATLSLVSFQACTTYEDGPAISFRSKFERAVNVWSVKNAYRDLVDVTAWYKNMQMDLRRDGRLVIQDHDELDSLVTQHGFWDFANDDADMRFIYTVPAVNPDRSTYEILRLQEDELWVQEERDSFVWEYRLIPAGLDSLAY